MIEPAKHPQVLSTGEVLVHSGVLTRQPDRSAHGIGLSQHIVARDCRRARIWLEQGSQHPNRGRLARAVGA